MSLPVTNIYVDSLYKTADSISSSNFKIELPYTITMPKDAVFTIDEVCIPHAWYTIEENVNDKMYLFILNLTTRATQSIIIQIPEGNYTGDLLKSALQTVFNSALAGIGVSLTVSYNSNTVNISINVSGAFEVQILSDKEIANNLRGYWNAAVIIDHANHASMNDVLRNYGGVDGRTAIYSTYNPYESGFLNFQGINNIYISSPNLGSFKTIGPRGESTIIKKIPVSSEYGYMIIDRYSTPNDYLDCSRSTLRTLEFNIRSSKGHYVPMHDANVSFTLVFSVKEPE